MNGSAWIPLWVEFDPPSSASKLSTRNISIITRAWGRNNANCQGARRNRILSELIWNAAAQQLFRFWELRTSSQPEDNDQIPSTPPKKPKLNDFPTKRKRGCFKEEEIKWNGWPYKKFWYEANMWRIFLVWLFISQKIISPLESYSFSLHTGLQYSLMPIYSWS